MSSTFITKKLAKAGVKPKDYQFVLNPFDYSFEYTEGEGQIKVMPLSEVLPMEVVRVVKKMDIKLGRCHYNSLYIALFLKKLFNIDIQVCDGFYYLKKEKRYYHHTFCKYNGKYFDATIELNMDFGNTKEFCYLSIREFSSYEMQLYTIICGRLVDCVGKSLYCSSLGNNPYYVEDAPNTLMINSEGYLQYVVSGENQYGIDIDNEMVYWS